MKKYLRLLRVQHYIKNILVFVAPFFGKVLFNVDTIRFAFLSFMTFSFLSSSIYIINDIYDIEKDRKHPVKFKRPIASGEISIKSAKLICTFMFIAAIIIQFFNDYKNLAAWFILVVYFVINILYSICGIKNIPLIDVWFLALGFLMRVFYGSVNTNVNISKWLLLVIISGSLYLGFGKRRNELVMSGNNTRTVLEFYGKNFLSQNMNSCMTLSIMFYSLWCLEKDSSEGGLYIYTIPLIMIIIMRYSMIVENDSDGDPVTVIIGDKTLQILTVIYIVLIFMIIYLRI